MSWYDFYKSVWDALVAVAVNLDELAEDTVFYGEKFPPQKFPSVYVCPGEAVATPATFRESYWNPQFDFGVVTMNQDTKAGFLQALQVIGNLIDALDADRSLGGIVQNMECVRVLPYWRGLGFGVETHWVGLIVRCEKKR